MIRIPTQLKYKIDKCLTPKILKEFKSWDMASAQSSINSYQNEKLIQLIFDKSVNFKASLQEGYAQLNLTEIQTINAIQNTLIENPNIPIIHVLDFGGGCGFHYFIVKKMFPTTKFRWHVIETEKMVEKAHRLESKELRFFSDIPSATKDLPTIDLLHSSCTLNYVQYPYDTLKELLAINYSYALFSRLACSLEKSDIVVLQKHPMGHNGPGPRPVGFQDEMCSYPKRFIQQQKIESIISKDNDILFRVYDASANAKVKKRKTVGLSYFLKPHI